MPSSESRRFELHQTLRDNFGDDVADTLMEHLPPSGWGDVARQSDLELLRVEIRSDLTEKLNSHLRWLIGLFSAQFIALLAIALR